MNDLQLFNNPEFGAVRAVEVDGEPWFVGKDVSLALGYTNPQKAIRDHVDAEDRTVNDSFTVNGTAITLINESGLYSLVLSSKLPGAKKFKRWVTAEVLPTIRKTGGDHLPQGYPSAPRALCAASGERPAGGTENEANRPKVLFADAVSTAKTSILVGELAKLLKQNGVDIGQNRLFGWLRENGFLIRRNGTDFNMPTQKSMDLGLFEIKETVVSHADGHTSVNKTPKVTGKGQQYFVQRFLGGTS